MKQKYAFNAKKDITKNTISFFAQKNARRSGNPKTNMKKIKKKNSIICPYCEHDNGDDEDYIGLSLS